MCSANPLERSNLSLIEEIYGWISVEFWLVLCPKQYLSGHVVHSLLFIA